MWRETISDALNLLNDDIIEETYNVRNNKKTYRKVWWKWIAAAACFLFVIVTAIKLLPQGMSGDTKNPSQKSKTKIADLTEKSSGIVAEVSEEPSNQAEKLPMLTVTEEMGEGMGSWGLMAYDVSELVNGNPWDESDKLSFLPVYKNQFFYGKGGKATKADTDKMQKLLEDVARRLDINIDSLTIKKNVLGADSERDRIVDLYAETGGIEIKVAQEMTVDITFEPSIPLPEEYHFTHSAAYDEVEAVAGYLREEYRELIAMENPRINIFGGDYSTDRSQMYHIEFFDAGKNSTERIINYNFNRVAFYCDDDGTLFLVRVYQPDLSRKTGDYPIITTKEAEKLLLNGNYITAVTDEFPGEDYIAKVELMYRTGVGEKYFMPYYCFYVELLESEEDGLKYYGEFYVPAVEKSYISNMPTWDGSVN